VLEVEIVGARRDRRKVQALARFIRGLRSLRSDRLREGSAMLTLFCGIDNQYGEVSNWKLFF